MTQTTRVAVQAIQSHLGAADDGVRRVVVFRPQRLLQVDRVHARVPAARGQYVGIVGERLLRETQQEAARNQELLEFHFAILLCDVGWEIPAQAGVVIFPAGVRAFRPARILEEQLRQGC